MKYTLIALAAFSVFCLGVGLVAHELGNYPSFSDIISDEWEEDYF